MAKRYQIDAKDGNIGNTSTRTEAAELAKQAARDGRKGVTIVDRWTLGGGATVVNTETTGSFLGDLLSGLFGK